MKPFQKLVIGIALSFAYIATSYGQLSWQPTNSLDSFPVFCMETFGNDLYAGMLGMGVYKTSDGGETWESRSVGLNKPYPSQILKKGNRLFLGTLNKGVYVSNNDGESWERTDTTIHQTVYALATKGNWLFAGTSNGFYRSNNNGSTWEKINHSYKSLLQRPIYSLLVSGNNLLAGSRKYIFWSTDNGDTWTPINTGSNGDIKVAISHGNKLYLGSSSNGIYQSSLTGKEWSSFELQTPDMKNIKALIIANDSIVVGVPTRGVAVSGELNNTGLPTDLIGSLVYHKGKLYAGTYWNGVWKLDRQQLPSQKVARPNTFKIYPNPTAPHEVTLSYNIEEAQEIEITLLNNNGQRLKNLTRNHQYKGWYKEEIDLNGLSPGIYHCVLKTKNENRTQKLIIARQ